MVSKLTYVSKVFFNWVFQIFYVFILRLKYCAINNSWKSNYCAASWKKNEEPTFMKTQLFCTKQQSGCVIKGYIINHGDHLKGDLKMQFSSNPYQVIVHYSVPSLFQDKCILTEIMSSFPSALLGHPLLRPDSLECF